MPRDLETHSTRAFRLTNYGVEFRRPITAREFEDLGHLLARIANATPWAVGDWLLAGEHMWNDGERYRVAMAITGQRKSRLRACVRVSVSYVREERGLLPWSFYRAGLALGEGERMSALHAAKAHGWTLETFERYVRRQRGEAEPAASSARALVTCPRCGSRFSMPPRVSNQRVVTHS